MEDSTAYCPPAPVKKRKAAPSKTAVRDDDDDDEDAKKQEGEVVQSQQYKDDEFAETLTTPMVEECIWFLERNTTMRYINGLLMEQEKLATSRTNNPPSPRVAVS
jgi:hypothetical protein